MKFYFATLFLANIKQAIDKTIVTGVNTIFSKLFIANKLPIVFNANKTNIIHNITFINLLDLHSFICLCFVIETNKNNAFRAIDTPSKTNISLSFCNLPPQAIA